MQFWYILKNKNFKNYTNLINIQFKNISYSLNKAVYKNKMLKL